MRACYTHLIVDTMRNLTETKGKNLRYVQYIDLGTGRLARFKLWSVE